MSVPNVVGGITTGSSFFIANILSGAPVVLNFALTTSGVKYYYWETDVNVAVQNANFPFFTATPSGNGFTIKDMVNSGFIAWSVDYPYSINGQATTTTLNSQYADWGGNTLMLSQAYYIPYVSGVQRQFKFGRQGSGVEGQVPGAMFLPASWFFCNSTTSITVKGKAQTLINWFCFTKPGLGVCNGVVPIYPSGFVDNQECLAQFPYPYCLQGQTCGNNSCKGPCSNGNSTNCIQNANQFVCTGGNPNDPENVWWRSTWFIVLMVGVGLLAIGALILAIVMFTRKGKDKDENDVDDNAYSE